MRKTVLITGASSGVGKASAKLFAERGWQVVAGMRRPYVEKELTALENVLVARLDVEERRSIEEAVHAGLSRFGKIDVLINACGSTTVGLFESVSRARIEEHFDVNVFGAMDVMRAILPHFRKNGAGLVINISGSAGISGMPMMSLCSAGRFAMQGFSEAVAYELASQNIGVKLVIPQDEVSRAGFHSKTSKERAVASTLSEYDDFIHRANGVLVQIAEEHPQSFQDVARVIYEAATDGADRLRYFAGDDSRGFIRARQEMSDHDYLAFMRAQILTPTEVES